MPEGLEDLKAMWQQLKAHVERLAGERQHYLDIFERSDEAYLVTDRDGVIEDLNGAAVDILQRRRRYLRGKPIAALVAPQSRKEFRNRLGQLSNEAVRAASWRTAFIAVGEGEVTVSARVLGRSAQGIGWLLRPGA